ncbi:hypothetical protein FIV06_24055 [Labrenzia sp. THAF191b]|uniref:hypothetical protein n=1 Tax=unclassified Labrenzia TaxID=2648686 RepID=UPI001267CD9C|nr:MULTISPECIES: hypothetical protein [unclassified Labrenzia]QFT00524.1 hypothetical protein FIV06_24055 [Labrenzia sp. THAF191b]QFT06837.1 hypothetical protein FIV05_24050 [Labrenzia sp. THAF191a]QFT18381.1 hypothetical protein FIV03_24065 [Labrenzia sp. THAF187b]
MESLIDTLRAAAPYLLFSVIALSLLFWVLAVLACRNAHSEHQGEFGDWPDDSAASSKAPLPVSEVVQSVTERAIYGLALSILVGEALFAANMKGLL